MRTSDTSITTLVEPNKIQSLLGSWEKRASASSGGVPDIARLAMSSSRSLSKSKVATSTETNDNNSRNKSTKQTMEDLAIFVSPREIKKKFHIPPKNSTGCHAKDPSDDSRGPAILVQHRPLVSSPTITASCTKKSLTTQPIDVPTVGSIRDRMKTFERNHDPNNQDTQAPWISREFRGKRGSVLDRFTPKTTMKKTVLSKRNHHNSDANEGGDLPLVSVFQPSEEKVNVTSSTEPKESPLPSKANTTDAVATKQVELSAPASPKNIKSVAKIDRDTLVLTEIRKMIQDTEDNEIEDDMDEEVKECLIEAAVQSPAYTRRWYDALTDSWIHCPSLATIIMDFTLIEAAEALYGDELPMLYTVSLRSVASEMMNGEEVLPEYIYRLAS